ncbi:hypothetical protein BDW02DRAFT_486305 [Decorospora gaudefroyi]|uniref:Uncharacterized protein n=1 Tax=Decorospora gaudefroyi TaxID=184978 RepID=A0A6A5KWM0_9PLEO|nr:hypothetical protein BDW02DRAFT_486305 [Decorospora gaudefroyi]
MDTACPIDPLVAQTALKIAAVINDFKRQLDQRDQTWALATGTIELGLHSQNFHLVLVPDEDGDEYPITVQATRKPQHDAAPSGLKRARQASDDDAPQPLDTDLVPRKRQKQDLEIDPHPRLPSEPDGNGTPITRAAMDDLLVSLRDDIQEDTTECINHVQRLLRPSPAASHDRADQTTSIPDLVRREAKLLSHQIRWVEECRKVGAELHDQREETWRTSSASFHDRQRQHRETFQAHMLHASGAQTEILHRILNEVRAIGLHTQSMKWETPASFVSATLPSNFPTQPRPPAATLNASGGGKGEPPARTPSQR